jgi:hypothetical protein
MSGRKIIEGQAERLLKTGWLPNLAHGSVTCSATGKAGLVEHAVWKEMHRVLSLGAPFQPTQPGSLTA